MRCLVTILALSLTLALSASAQSAAAGSTAPLRVVIVGLVHGHVSGFLEHYRNDPRIEIVGIAEPNEQLAQQYALKFNLDSKLLFTDLETALATTHPQAALLYTSTYDHTRAVEICARHHVPVMMEKPLAVSLADAAAMQKAAHAGGIPVLVNYETTWYRSNRAVYDLVQQNALGDIRKVVVHDGHRGPKEISVEPEFLAWLTDPKLDGAGALFDFGCYGADLMTWLMNGQRPESVTAVAQTIKPDIYPKVDDEATVILKYHDAQAIIQASWNWPFDRKDIEVYGQTGYAITVGRDQVRERLAGSEERVIDAQPIPPPDEDPVSYLRAVVLGGMKPSGLSSLETNILVVEILDAARRSAATGKTVALPAANHN